MPSDMIIGVGNIYRCDDAAGLIVVRHLQKVLPKTIQICEQSRDGVSLLDSWRDAQRVILIDAVQSGIEPGTIHKLNATHHPLPSTFYHTSTHAFGPAEAVELARVMGQLPPSIIVYGIEGENFSHGEHISPKVEAAIEEVSQRIIEYFKKGEEACTNNP